MANSFDINLMNRGDRVNVVAAVVVDPKTGLPAAPGSLSLDFSRAISVALPATVAANTDPLPGGVYQIQSDSICYVSIGFGATAARNSAGSIVLREHERVSLRVETGQRISCLQWGGAPDTGILRVIPATVS